MSLLHVLNYRLDFALLLVLSVIVFGIGLRTLRRRLAGRGFSAPVIALMAALLAAGLWSAVTAENKNRAILRQMVGGLAPTFAYEFEKLGHARLDFDTPPDDPLYLTLIEHQKAWLKRNPNVIDIYTYRRRPDGKVGFIVDSETDYDRDGVYGDGRERRTPIGYEYATAASTNDRALAGEAVFDTNMITDEWGTFVSFYQPMYDAGGRVEGALGIDLPADVWISTLLAARGGSLLLTFILLTVVTSSSVWFSLMKAEIATRRRAQEEALRAKESADRANQAKSEFLAAMSHEIRTPMNGILGFSSLLMDTPLNSDQRDYVHTLKGSADSLLQLLNDILDLSKIEAGRVTLEQIPFPLHKTLVEVTTLLAPRAAEKSLVLSLENEAGPIHVVGDPGRLRQILLNLVSNAVKFTATGRVLLRVRWQPPTTSSAHTLGTLRCDVTDTGIGIPPNEIKRLFQRFSQVDSSTTRRYGGSGLGLVISRQLAGLMGGTLTVESVAGRGSTFTLQIPTTLAAPPAPVVSFTDSAPPVLPEGVSGHVLLAEDNPTNRKLASHLLKKLGYRVDVANNGRECVALAAVGHYDLILMDCEMPELDGFSATRAIRRAEPPTRRVPIIALTANALAGVEAECLAAGMDAYLTKPVQVETLRSTLQRLAHR
ncbi:MAG: arcB [Rariglobus sp.]|jgi:signal transduction histidine kinase/CheY-like chemotaxis protein|nr:arcB [Rariglobus sp.]